VNEGKIVQPDDQPANGRRWGRWAVAAVACVVVASIAYFTVQQYRVRPAPRLTIEQVGWVEIRTSETRLLGPPRDKAEITEIVSGWNASDVGPLRGETTPWYHITIYLRDGRVFAIYGGETPRMPVLCARGRCLERYSQVYPSERLKVYILRLLKDYKELDR
jgi:hypothetical protein